MDKRRICKHRVLAGFLAFLMFWSVFFTGIGFSIKGGIFNGGSIKGIIEKNGFNEILYNVCDEFVDKEFKDKEFSWITENDNYNDIKEELIDIVLDGLLEKKDDVSFDSVVDKIIACVEDQSEVIVDEVFEEIENLSEDFDARENEYVQSIVDTYSIEVSDEFYDELNSYTQYADNLDEYKDEIKAEIDTQIIEPVKNEKDNISADLNEAFKETLDEYYAGESFKTIESANDMLGMLSTGLNLVCIFWLAISLVFMLIICLLYRSGIFGAFSKFAVITGISGAFLLLVGSVKNVFISFLDSVSGAEVEELKEAIGDNYDVVVDKLLSGVFDPFMKTGITYIVIMVVCIVIWAVTKSIYKNKMNNDTKDYTNLSYTSGTTTNYTNMTNANNNSDGGQIM